MSDRCYVCVIEICNHSLLLSLFVEKSIATDESWDANFPEALHNFVKCAYVAMAAAWALGWAYNEVLL